MTRDELEQELLADNKFQHILKFAPQSQRELMTFELANYFHRYTAEKVLEGKIEIIQNLSKNEDISFDLSVSSLAVLQAELTQLRGTNK